MADKQEHEMSVTDFGKLIGVSKAYVSQQIKNENHPFGCLIKGVRIDPMNFRVYLDVATCYEQWKTAGLKMAVAGRKKAESLIAEKGWKSEVTSNLPPGMDNDEAEDDNPQGALDTIERYKDFGKISPNESMFEATRRKEVANAGIAELKFLQLQGTLVNKQEVYNTLFEFGQELSIKIQEIPERVAPYIRSAIPDQIVAHDILERIRKEIEEFQVTFSAGPKESSKEEEPTENE